MNEKYKVVNVTNGKILKKFEKKREAKAFRNEMSSLTQTNLFRIGRTEDHKKGESKPKLSNKLRKKLNENKGN